jgi:hypothetical protein
MSGIWPANPAARKAEEAVRERARQDAIDRICAMEAKLDSTLDIKKEASPSPVQDLALAIGQDRILLPLAVIVSRTLNDEGDEVATAIRVGHLTFTIEEAVSLGVLTLDGRLNRPRLTTLLDATRPGWRPLYAARGPNINPRQSLPST